MANASKDTKVQHYRNALNMKDENPQLTWTQCCKDCNSSSKYPYIGKEDRESRTLDTISAAFNLIDNRDNVGLAFRDRIIQKYGLINPEANVNPLDRSFSLGEYSIEEILAHLKSRNVVMEKVRILKKVITYEEEPINY